MLPKLIIFNVLSFFQIDDMYWFNWCPLGQSMLMPTGATEIIKAAYAIIKSKEGKNIWNNYFSCLKNKGYYYKHVIGKKCQ